MKISKNLFLLGIGLLLVPFTASCATSGAAAKSAEKPAAQSSEAPVKNQKATAKKEPEKTPEVKFVENLSSALAKGDEKDALALFEKMPAAVADDPGLQTLKGSLLLSSGKDAEAEQLAAELLAKNPTDGDVLELNIMIAKKKGDNAKKSQLLKQVLAVDPKNAVANVELGSEQALKRNYRNARDYFRTAVSSEPENVEALFGFGKMSYYLNKDDDAKQSFKKILEVDPENPEALVYLGKFEAEARRYKNAKSYVERAIKSDPENSDFYFDLGTYCRNLGDYNGAEQAWTKAKDLDPEYFLGYAYLAGLYDELEKSDLAYENYKLVVEKNPKYYYAYESLGMHAWRNGDFKDAIVAFEKARKVNPENMSYPLMVAACYQKLKNMPECKKYTESVWKNMDRNSLEYHMLRLFHDMGGEAPVTLKVQNETNKTKRGKMLFYLAVYFELKGNFGAAQKYYSEIAQMQGAMFFEYRMAKWKTGEL